MPNKTRLLIVIQKYLPMIEAAERRPAVYARAHESLFQKMLLCWQEPE